MDTLHTIISHYGYAGIYAWLMVGIFGVPVPDETLLFFTGYLVSRGDLGLIPSLAAAGAGTITGGTVNYLVGRTLGARLLARYGHFVRLTPERLARVDRWFTRVGRWSLSLAYFFPGLRHLTPLAAGMAKLRFRVFALFAYGGGLCWSATFVLAGYYGGREGEKLARHLHVALALAGVCLVLAGGVWAWWQARSKKRG